MVNTSLNRFFVFSWCILAAVKPCLGDRVVVRRPANIRSEPNIQATSLQRAEPGESYRLLDEEQSNGYYRVALTMERTGWIYRTFVRRFADDSSLTTGTASGFLEVHVIDVGQADAIFLRCPDGEHQMLIDAGDNRYPGSGANLRSYLMQHQSLDDTIEVVVATHPHADHIGNMAWVLRTYNVELYVDNGNVYDSRTYDRVERAWEEGNAGYWSAADDMVPIIDFCPRLELTAQVLVPNGFGKDDTNENNNSVVIRVDYLEDSFLFVGDAEKAEEHLLMADETTRALLDVDFLKAGHHGSSTSSSEEFLALITPEIVAISCGARGVGTNIGYRHPRLERVQTLHGHCRPRLDGPVTIDAFETTRDTWNSITLSRATYVTTAEGNLVFESSGHGIQKR